MVRLSRRPRRPRLRRSTPRLRGRSINRMLPNMLTLFALCAGLTAIRFALDQQWQAAVIAIVIAAVFDMLDGRVARLLNVTSPLGAQLDSLSDFASFGVAPALVLYLWLLNDLGNLGWIVALTYCICAALRLARFNVSLGDAPTRPPWAYNYFTGMPSPAAAAVALLPLVLGFLIGKDVIPALPVAIWLLAVGGMMISTLPTFSFKGGRVPERYVPLVLVGIGLTAAGLFNATWLTLMVLGVLYLATLPLAMRQFHKLQAEAERMQGLESAGDGDPAGGAQEGPSLDAAPDETGPGQTGRTGA